jgi:4-oxalocrotonate tautomerase
MELWGWRRGSARSILRVQAIRPEEETRMPEVYVHAIEGRSPEQKKALMADITEAVMRHFNTPAESVVVTVVESRKTEKMKGGKLFTER